METESWYKTSIEARGCDSAILRSLMRPEAKLPYCRHPCKSVVKRKTRGLKARSGERALVGQNLSLRNSASRRRVAAFLAEPDIHLRSRAPESRHRRLSLCSLPVPKQFGESLGRVTSFAQSAISRTWQSAHGKILMFFPSQEGFYATAVR